MQIEDATERAATTAPLSSPASPRAAARAAGRALRRQLAEAEDDGYFGLGSAMWRLSREGVVGLGLGGPCRSSWRTRGSPRLSPITAPIVPGHSTDSSVP